MVRQKKAYNWPGAGGRAGRVTALPLFRASVLVPRQMESGMMIYLESILKEAFIQQSCF